MDELESACAAVINIQNQKPGGDLCLDDLRLFGLRKSLNLRYAIEDLNTVLRARFAPRFSSSPQGRSGNAETVALSSHVVTKAL